MTVPTAGTYTVGARALCVGSWDLNWLRVTKGETLGTRAAREAATQLVGAKPVQPIELRLNSGTYFLLIRANDNLTGSRYQVLNTAGKPMPTGLMAVEHVNVSTLKAGSHLLRLHNTISIR